MSKRIGSATVAPDNLISVSSFSAIGGKKEGEGPYGSCFDYIDTDGYFGQKSFERAESAMQGLALQNAVEKRKITPEELSFIIGGDLLDQCIGTSFGTKDFSVPFLGVYGACSTMAEGLLLSALLADSGAGDIIAAVTSSHFCTAERQYRFPLEYGGQRTPTSQWTATASGALTVERGSSPPFVRAVTVGKIVDKGIKDANNMGAAMAPAAYSTISQFFKDTGFSPENFDAIVTGDLGNVGSRLLCELFEKDGADIEIIKSRHLDCGRMIYDQKSQDVHAGGSGLLCSAGIFFPSSDPGAIKTSSSPRRELF